MFFKKAIVTLLSVLALLWLIILISGYTQVIYLSPDNSLKSGYNKEPVKGDAISILEGMDLTQGSWKAYLITDRDDVSNLSAELGKANCYKTSDIDILKGMQRNWIVVLTGGDMGTIQSKLILLKDGKVEFASGIVIGKDIKGLQSERLGWVEPINERVLSEYCKKFKRVYFPVIFL
jgi:hypothetical protein